MPAMYIYIIYISLLHIYYIFHKYCIYINVFRRFETFLGVIQEIGGGGMEQIGNRLFPTKGKCATNAHMNLPVAQRERR